MDVYGNNVRVNEMSKLLDYVDGSATNMGDGIVATGTMALAIVLVIWLGGCAQIGRFAANDAEQATDIAAAVGDNAGKACWPLLATVGNAIAASGSTVGPFTAIEQKRALQVALQDQACQPVWAGVLGELLKATPAAPFLP